MRHGFSGLKSKGNGLHLVGVGGDTLGSTLGFPLVGPRSGARTVEPRTLRSIRLKCKVWPWGPKCGTDSRGLSPKATGLHLVGVGGDTLGSTLALPASWAEVSHKVDQECVQILLSEERSHFSAIITAILYLRVNIRQMCSPDCAFIGLL